MMVQLEDIIIERHEQKRTMTSGYSILREEVCSKDIKRRGKDFCPSKGKITFNENDDRMVLELDLLQSENYYKFNCR